MKFLKKLIHCNQNTSKVVLLITKTYMSIIKAMSIVASQPSSIKSSKKLTHCKQNLQIVQLMGHTYLSFIKKMSIFATQATIVI